LTELDRRSVWPPQGRRNCNDGPRPEGTFDASLPGGAGRRTRSRVNGPGIVIRFIQKEPDLTAGRVHRHDLALRTVRQHGRGHRRGPVRQHAGSAIRQPRDKKTPGAPTPSVPESCWDVWTPEIDPAVAKR
jgi:hypothetical protein